MIDTQQFLAGYIDAALWSTTDVRDPDTPECSGSYSLDDEFSEVSPTCRAAMLSDCQAFIAANATKLVDFRNACEIDDFRLGCLFWLNRSGHGSGFWDEAAAGTWAGDMGDDLSEACRPYGTFELYGDFEMGCVRSHHYG